MQLLLRTNGMNMGDLLTPEQPGHVIAALALKGPRSLSGQFVTWNDDNIKEFQLPGQLQPSFLHRRRPVC